MPDILRIAAVEVVLPGVLKVAWNDGYEGIVDLGGAIAEGEIFEHIRNPDNFENARLESHGHSIYWGQGGGKSISAVID